MAGALSGAPERRAEKPRRFTGFVRGRTPTWEKPDADPGVSGHGDMGKAGYRDGARRSLPCRAAASTGDAGAPSSPKVITMYLPLA